MEWNKEAAIRLINARAGTRSQHACARYTREAIAAGGIKLDTTNLAKNYGSLLERAGFVKLLPGETILAGDVIVIHGITADDAGHMAMFNGSFWVSDFRQSKDIYPGPGYRKARPSYQIYRMK